MSSKSSKSGGNSSSKGGAKTPEANSSSNRSAGANTPVTVNQVYKSYGGFRNFMHSYGLKMRDHEDVLQAKALAEEMANDSNNSNK